MNMQQTNKPQSILLIEDDINLGYLLVENLQSKGFAVTLKQNGRAAIDAFRLASFDLCVIDIMLPGADGFSVAEALRNHSSKTPFIFLTARIREQDKLQGFELGADDYITKPFSFKELYYRILVVLRRHREAEVHKDTVVSMGALSLNPSQRMMTISGQTKKLSHRESGLLQVLLEHKGKYVNRGEILRRVWGNDDYFTGKSMDVYVTRLRKLLKEIPDLEIENLYGTGYRIRQNTPEGERAA